MENGFVPRVMIDGDEKEFKKSELDKIMKSSGFSIPGAAIKVVSIIGAQNSGKSTLMNSLFSCRFEVMNADEGIQQTTKGMWASECIIPNLLVLDVEGSDGKERAKTDTSFERQSALFALTVSDVMIFNMWAKDVGRNEGGSVPLFTTIFQVTAAGFSFSAQELWKQIEQNKQLDLPTHREMVSGHFCGEVKKECLASLESDKDYLLLKAETIKFPKEFSYVVECLIKRLTERYEVETKMYDERIKDENKKGLIDEIIRFTSTCANNFVTGLQSKMRSKTTQLIFAALNEDHTTDVYNLVETSVGMYKTACEVLLPRYPELFSQRNIDAMKSDLTAQAKQLVENCRKERARYDETERMRKDAEKRTTEVERAIREINMQLEKRKLDNEIETREHKMERARLQAQKQEAERVAREFQVERARLEAQQKKASEETERMIREYQAERARIEAQKQQVSQEAARVTRELSMRLEKSSLDNQALVRQHQVEREKLEAHILKNQPKTGVSRVARAAVGILMSLVGFNIPGLFS